MNVPSSQAEILIPLDSLRKLPQNAEFRTKSGQANAVVKFKQDTIIVFAICDSLKRQCEYYEALASTYKEASEGFQRIIQEEKEQYSNPIRIVLLAFLAGVIMGILLTNIVTRKFKSS